MQYNFFYAESLVHSR